MQGQEVIAKRVFDPLFIFLDIVFLVIFIGLLIWNKKYMTLLVGLLSGIMYMIADFGFFHLIYHSRTVTGGNIFWVLLWMSMSYGFTNFVWIWLWISKDKKLFEWSLLILAWWLCGPMIAQTFGGHGEMITTSRTTSGYHGTMAIMLFVGYLFLIIWNLRHNDKLQRINIPWILIIGVLVQFGWEMGLLLGGIRSEGRTAEQKFMTVITNSLLETNLGMPYIYMIFIAYSSKFTEQLKKRTDPVSFIKRIEENNLEKVRCEA